MDSLIGGEASDMMGIDQDKHSLAEMRKQSEEVLVKSGDMLGGDETQKSANYITSQKFTDEYKESKMLNPNKQLFQSLAAQSSQTRNSKSLQPSDGKNA